MRIKVAQIILIVYLILVSFITKKTHLISFTVFLVWFLIENYLLKNNAMLNRIDKLVYLLIAFLPFPNLLYIFAIYLPFVVFGSILTKKGFIKSYIFGFAVSIIPTIILYTAANYLKLKLNFFIILAVFYLPVILAFFVLKKERITEFLNLDLQDYAIAIAILISTVYVGINIADNNSLFISNGTYYYSKFDLIVKSIQNFNTFPIYDPGISNGESPFLFETPLVFSHLAFSNILLYFIPPILFYNSYSLFMLFISTLSLSILIMSIIGATDEISNLAIIILGSSIIGLHFYFAQFLESFKAFFALPIDYLIFAIILEKPTNIKEITAIFYLIVLSFIIHVAHGIGIVLFSFSLIFLIMANLYFKNKLIDVKNWLLKNKLVLAVGLLVIISITLFYITSSIIFKDFLEEPSKFDLKGSPKATIDYIKGFLTGNTLSLKYPDTNRNDDKKLGAFISILGLISLICIFLFYKVKSLGNARLFAGAYIMHFAVSSIIINFPLVMSMEYIYRTVEPYLLVVLVASMCSVIANIKNKYVKIFMILLFLAAFMHMLPLVKENITNIHREEVASGNFFKEETGFLRSLPNDGRIITYGLFSSAIDPAMARLTDKYFSRNLLTTNPRSRSIYEKIHGTHAWGVSDDLYKMSGAELSNYLRLGGFKYIFANACIPAGDFIAKNLYPKFIYPIYVNNNQCLVVFVVNNTNYVESSSVLKKIENDVYKNEDGYKYITTSSHYKLPDKIEYSNNPLSPKKLDFKRINPTEVEIYGNFNDNDFVVFKEDYFSRWKAYMNSKNVPVLANNHNLILINTIKGDRILLKYEVLAIEMIFGVISLVAALILVAILILFLR